MNSSFGGSKWVRRNIPGDASSEQLDVRIRCRTIFSIGELIDKTKFTKNEIKIIYRDFKSSCPGGLLNERMLSRIYSNIFIAGDCTVFAKHLYSAIVGNIRSDSKPEVNFEDFIVSLSTIMRGSQEERIKWLFNFYDIQKDGRISRDELMSLIKSLYDLIGPNVRPAYVVENVDEHVDMVIKRFNLDNSVEPYISYSQFYSIFSNDKDLLEQMMMNCSV